MSKRKVTELTGYVMQVSPRKKNKTFNIEIQTKNGNTERAICFDTKKYNDFLTSQQSGDPVKIQNITEQQHDNPKFAKYVINTRTTINKVNPVSIGFEKIEHVEHYLNLSAIDHLADGDLVNLKAKLDMQYSAEETIYSDGRSLKVLNDVYAFNEDGDIKITLWEEWINYFKNNIESNKTYFKIKQLVVKEFGNVVYLSTCSRTDVEVMMEDGPECDLLPKETMKTITIPGFDSIGTLDYKYECLKCKKKFEATDGILQKCIYCNTTSRASSLTSHTMVEVQGKLGDSVPFCLDLKSLRSIITDIDVCSFKTDADVVIQEIMNLTNLKITINNENKIVKVDKVCNTV